MPARTARWIASDSAVHSLRRAVAHVDHGGAGAARGVDLARGVRAEDAAAGSATFSARAPGKTPRLPTPLAAAAATAAVAVPWKSVSDWPPVVATLPDANSGWVMSSWESTSAISGLDGVTAGGASAGSTTRSRQGEAGESGSGAGACARVE